MFLLLYVIVYNYIHYDDCDLDIQLIMLPSIGICPMCSTISAINKFLKCEPSYQYAVLIS